MPIQQLPLMKGVGKDFRNADYIDYLPVNMLATPKEILNSSGYLRSFPGIAKRSDVNGVSRGVEYNMAQNAVYRVCGGKLYKGESEVGDVAGSGRVFCLLFLDELCIHHLLIAKLKTLKP